MDYVSRELSEEDKKKMLSEVDEKDLDIGGEKVYLETDAGEILTDKKSRSALLKEWSADFVGGDYTKRQEWKLEHMDRLKAARDVLESNKNNKDFSKDDELKLAEIKKNIKEKKITLKGKEYNIEVRSPKDTTHMILSVGGKHSNKNVSKATEAVREFCSKNFAESGYKYAFAAHTDTDNLHFHLIVKNVNEISRKRLRMDKADLFVFIHNPRSLICATMSIILMR